MQSFSPRCQQACHFLDIGHAVVTHQLFLCAHVCSVYAHGCSKAFSPDCADCACGAVFTYLCVRVCRSKEKTLGINHLSFWLRTHFHSLTRFLGASNSYPHTFIAIMLLTLKPQPWVKIFHSRRCRIPRETQISMKTCKTAADVLHCRAVTIRRHRMSAQVTW